MIITKSVNRLLFGSSLNGMILCLLGAILSIGLISIISIGAALKGMVRYSPAEHKIVRSNYL